MPNQEFHRIRRLNDVGDTPFQFLGSSEPILQGWDNAIKKSVFLFKTENNVWGYFSKESNSLIENVPWNKKAALINGRWINMGLYHRIDVRFYQPVLTNVYDKQSNQSIPTYVNEANIIITDKLFKILQSQSVGRPENSFYRIVWVEKKNKGRNTRMPENVEFVM